MGSKASENELSALHGVVARFLAERIASGEASASDVSNAIKMLKDNNITVDVDTNTDLKDLKDKLNDKPGTALHADSKDLASALEHLEFIQGGMH